MSKVQEIEQLIEKLSRTEFHEIREWILERDWAHWDTQLDKDIKARKLEDLVSESQEDYRSGRSRRL
jgi:hypothetical protein